ncbi:uncharacterized protein LOC113336620 [Papaver somniferum]|uniref:uncharacterized protein LOC113336620 n=1 Tax=Papaver somniferum TaxID=3469 RepID=UPI000E6FD28D|nr:uncharacterized protein LOC113336620 [Papaver somniferum]
MWINCCIQRIRFAILVNGSSCGKFACAEVLFQGDPLSPFIFLLISEVLNIMLSKALVDGKLGGFTAKYGGTSIYCMQFQDDTLVFLDADLEQVRFLKFLLFSFEFASGLCTNFSKCSLFVVGEVVNLDVLASVLGCSCDSFPGVYLGLPLGEQILSKTKLVSFIFIMTGDHTVKDVDSTTRELKELLKALNENHTRESASRTADATSHGEKLDNICFSLQNLTSVTTAT